MNDKIVEFISDVDISDFDAFEENLNLDTSLSLDMQLNDYNCSWLDSLEEYLPFISNIVTIDYTNSNIVLKSYENRFIKTLIYMLYNFLLSERKKIVSISESNSKSIVSKLNTIVESEKIEIEIKVKTTKIEESKNGNSYGLSLVERIDRVLNIVTSLISSDFITSLDDISIITDEINKTEVFEQELNYRKAYELYEIIKKIVDGICEEDEDVIKENINNKLLVTSYLEYQLLKKYNKVKSEGNIYKEFIERLIEKMVLEYSMDEKSFKKMITKKFEEEYNKKKTREKNIQNIFLKTQDNYNKQIKDATRALKG